MCTARRNPTSAATSPTTMPITSTSTYAERGRLDRERHHRREREAHDRAPRRTRRARARDPAPPSRRTACGSTSHRLQHRDVARAFERGEVHHRRDDARRHEPQQRVEDRDRLRPRLLRPVQVFAHLGVGQDLRSRRRGAEVPRTAIAVAYGWPARKLSCTSFTGRNTVG